MKENRPYPTKVTSSATMVRNSSFRVCGTVVRKRGTETKWVYQPEVSVWHDSRAKKIIFAPVRQKKVAMQFLVDMHTISNDQKFEVAELTRSTGIDPIDALNKVAV